MKEDQERTPLRTILQNFLNHIENLDAKKIEGSYEKEFQELKLFSEILKSSKQYSCSQGEKEVNRKKNRYKDILPFDGSRVILDGYAGVPGSDYINANFIKGASGSPAYIASQGPLPHTVNDFWRMVVECEVQVIVMACNEEEAGKHKCEKYWVENEGEEKQFGMVTIQLVKASVVCPDFLVRTMRLKYSINQSTIDERTVCQFHYSAWPDHGVPPLVRPLLDMVRLVRDTQASETLPVLVHCSAGCGRTGTICAIDYVWGLLRAGKLTKDFSLFKLVHDMRRQRIAMVQTKEQYVLIHHAVRELFCEQLRMIDSHPYENIDVNGLPLVKGSAEPMYATVINESYEEKQDNKEKECSAHEESNIPPLPHKKRTHIASSKQEKEVENLTEKHRSFVEHSSCNDTSSGSSVSSLLQKSSIAKLKALFERSSPNRESRNLHSKRSSQQVTRSHSLGAVRKCGSIELSGNFMGARCQEESNPNCPTSCNGVFQISHPTNESPVRTTSGRPALPIKRSKSLKVLGSSDRYKLSLIDVDKNSSLKAAQSQFASEVSCDQAFSFREASASISHLNHNVIKDNITSDMTSTVPPNNIVISSISGRDACKNGTEVKFVSKHYINVNHFPQKHFENNVGLVPQCRRRKSLETFSSVLEDAGAPIPNTPIGNLENNCSQITCECNHLNKDANKLWNDCHDYLSSTRSESYSHKSKTGCKDHNIQSAETSKIDFQNLTEEAQRKINSIIAGLGIRERRNSFRQAINTSKEKGNGASNSKLNKCDLIQLNRSLSSDADGNANAVQAAVASNQDKCLSECVPECSQHLGTQNIPIHGATGNKVNVKDNVRWKVSQQTEKCCESIRTESRKVSYKLCEEKCGSTVRNKGKQAMSLPKELKLYSSKANVEVGMFQHYSLKGSSFPSRQMDYVAEDSAPAKRHISRSNLKMLDRTSKHRICMPKTVRPETLEGSSSSSQENARKYPLSSIPIMQQCEFKLNDLRTLNITGNKRDNSSETCVSVLDPKEKMFLPVESKCSRASALLPRWGHKEEAIHTVNQDYSKIKSHAIPMLSERPRAAKTYALLQGSRVRSPKGGGYGIVDRGLMSLSNVVEVGNSGVLRRQEQMDNIARPVAVLHDRAAASGPQDIVKHMPNEMDVVSYGLVAGVQLQRGSQDKLVPPRVHRHASVVLLRHSLIETCKGNPTTSLTVRNAPQEGQGQEAGSCSGYNPVMQNDAWTGAPGVDLDAVAASIKPHLGPHLVQSPPVKKQHYL